MIIDKLNNKYWHIWANYGHYGIPPQFSSFAIQLSVWLTIVIFVKFITYSTQLELAIPLGSFMNYILSDLESNPKLELVVVMIIIPVTVNSLQFWLTDMVLKHDTVESTLDGGHMLPSLLSTIRSTSKSSTIGMIPSTTRSLSRQPSAENKNGFRPLALNDEDDEEEKEYEISSNIYHNNTNSSNNTMIHNTAYNKIHNTNNTNNTNNSDTNASSSDHQYEDSDLEGGQNYDLSDSLSLLCSHHLSSSLVDYRGTHNQPVNSNSHVSSPKIRADISGTSHTNSYRNRSSSGSSRTPPTSPIEVKNR